DKFLGVFQSVANRCLLVAIIPLTVGRHEWSPILEKSIYPPEIIEVISFCDRSFNDHRFVN
ncbi:MAG: hypothetical protein ABEK50_09990, partial [bacterium]